MGTRAVGYCRISLDATGEGRGVARQREDVEALINRNADWTLVADLFIENDTSASGRKKRPKFEAMMGMVEAGDVDVIVAYSMDRLTRNRRDQVRLIEACQQQHVTVAMVQGSTIDMSSAGGRMLAEQLAMWARFEIEQKGERHMRANKQRADEGRPTQGGRRAFGYEPGGMIVRESEAVHLRAAYDAVLAGRSLNSIARELNTLGVTTAYGSTFNHNKIRLVLMNPRNAAIYVYKGVETGRAAWPAIVPEETYRAAAAILTEPSRRTNHAGGERRRLLTGIARCGVCDDGTTVRGGSKSHGSPVYQCSKAKHLMRPIDQIDEWVEAVVIERLSRPDATDLLIDKSAPDLGALNTERLALVARQDEAAAMFATGDITAAMMRTITAQTTTRISEIDALMSHRNRERVLGDLVRADDPYATWKTMSLERRQAVLAELGTWTIERGIVGGRGGRDRYKDDPRVTFTPQGD